MKKNKQWLLTYNENDGDVYKIKRLLKGLRRRTGMANIDIITTIFSYGIRTMLEENSDSFTDELKEDILRNSPPIRKFSIFIDWRAEKLLKTDTKLDMPYDELKR